MVRCRACRAVVSEWAANCPSCRTPLDDAQPVLARSLPLADRGPEPATAPMDDLPYAEDPYGTDPYGEPTGEALNDGAESPAVRSTRQARRLLLVLTAAVAAAALAVTVTDHQSPSNNEVGLVAAARSYDIVYTGSTGTRLVPLDGSRPVLVSPVASSAPLQVSGGGVAYIQNRTLYLLGGGLESSAVPVQAADSTFPMLWPNTIGASVLQPSGRSTITFVAGTGTSELGTDWVLPPGYRPVAQFLVISPQGILMWWTPTRSTGIQLGPTVGPATAVIDVSANDVAWLGAGCARNGECELRVSPTASGLSGSFGPTGAVTAIPALRGHVGYLRGGAFSPDGQYLAVFVASGSGRASLVVIDLTDNRTQAIPGSEVMAKTPPAAHWSPDGSLLFYSGSAGPMHVWNVAYPRPATLDAPGSTSFAVTG